MYQDIILRTCTKEDCENYLSDFKKNQYDKNFSFYDFIQTNYYNSDSDKNKIIIAQLSDQNFLDLDFSNSNFQGTILSNNTFDNCTFNNTVFCDVDFNDTEFYNCTFIGTDFRGANLHYTDFHYDDIDDDGKINDLSSKINDIKVSFSDLGKLNKYINKDIENEQKREPEIQDLTSKLAIKKQEVISVEQSIENPGLFNRVIDIFSSNKSIKQHYQANLNKLKKLQSEVTEIESSLAVIDNLRMFCGINTDTIFSQLYDEKINVQTDPSYIIGSTKEERDRTKTIVKLSTEEFNKYITEAQQKIYNTNQALNISEYIIKEKNLTKDAFIICDLSEIELQGKTLENLDLRNALFVGNNLEDIKILNCDLRNANFEGANLKNSTFSNVKASNSKFIFANLNSTTINDSNFSRSYSPKIDLSKANIANSNFDDCMMINGDAQEAVIQNSDLNYSNLQGLSLAYSKMLDVRMREANLTNIYLNKAEIIKSDLENSIMNKAQGIKAKFLDTNMTNITARSSYFSDAEFENVILNSADLRETIMQRVMLRNSKMKEALLDKINLNFSDLTKSYLTPAKARFAKLNHAILDQVNAENIDLSDSIARTIQAIEANFTYAIMIRMEAERSNFTKSIFNNANLEYANMAESIFIGAQMIKANLQATDLSRSQADEANFYGTIINHSTKLHGITGKPTGKVLHVQENKEQDIKDAIEISNKVHAREQIPQMFKSKAGQLFLEGVKAIVKIGAFLTNNKMLAVTAIGIGIGVALLPFIAVPTLATIATAKAVIIGSAIASSIATYIISKKHIEPYHKNLKKFIKYIDRYIDPSPLENTEIQQEILSARAASQKAKIDNEKKVNYEIQHPVKAQERIIRKAYPSPSEKKHTQEEIPYWKDKVENLTMEAKKKLIHTPKKVKQVINKTLHKDNIKKNKHSNLLSSKKIHVNKHPGPSK